MTECGRGEGHRQAICARKRTISSARGVVATKRMCFAYDIRNETETTEIPNRGLSWLRLEFAVDRGDKRDVKESKVVVTDAELELTHSFNEGGRFDVSHGSTELTERNI